MKYYTLIIKENGIWSPQFGDPDKEAVKDERADWLHNDDTLTAADVKIIRTGSFQSEIDAKIKAINLMSPRLKAAERRIYS